MKQIFHVKNIFGKHGLKLIKKYNLQRIYSNQYFLNYNPRNIKYS